MDFTSHYNKNRKISSSITKYKPAPLKGKYGRNKNIKRKVAENISEDISTGYRKSEIVGREQKQKTKAPLVPSEYFPGLVDPQILFNDGNMMIVICSRLEKGFNPKGHFIFSSSYKSDDHPFKDIGSKHCFNVVYKEDKNIPARNSESPIIQLEVSLIYKFSVLSNSKVPFHISLSSIQDIEDIRQKSAQENKNFIDYNSLHSPIENSEYYIIFFVEKGDNLSNDIPMKALSYGSPKEPHSGNMILVFNKDENEE